MLDDLFTYKSSHQDNDGTIAYQGVVLKQQIGLWPAGKEFSSVRINFDLGMLWLGGTRFNLKVSV